MAGLTLAFAATLSGAAPSPAARSPSMPVGQRTSQPIGHHEFCKAAPSECGPTPDAGPAAMDAGLWDAVLEVQTAVNREVTPMSDMELHGVGEFWSYPEGAGDCEDYALEKRRRIHRTTGISLSNLLVTVVRRDDGEGHAVLTMRTTSGDFILDNLMRGVHRWDTISGYTFLKRQSSDHSGKWSAVLPVRPVETASAASGR